MSETIPPDASFGKKEHVCAAREVQHLLGSGKVLTEYPFRVIWLLEKGEHAVPVKVLISIPKKKIKSAVLRNLLKRRTKEAYRLNKQQLTGRVSESGDQLRIGLIYIAPEPLPFTEIQQKIIVILQRLSRNIHPPDRE